MQSLITIANAVKEMKDATRQNHSDQYYYGDLMITVSKHFGGSACSREIVQCVMTHKEEFVSCWRRAMIGEFSHEQKIEILDNMLETLLVKNCD